MINLTPLNGVDQDPIPSADVRTSMITSMHKTTTPLNAAFFQQGNLERIQMMLRKQFKDETGLSIDRQNPRDVLTFMRYVYINNAMNPYGNIEAQMRREFNDSPTFTTRNYGGIVTDLVTWRVR